MGIAGHTTRSCYIVLSNESGCEINKIALTHSAGSQNDTVIQSVMKDKTETLPKQINFQTGFWADFDYWNISFSIDNKRYGTPNNDRCNISAEDAGGTVYCRIKSSENSNTYMLHVEMPSSSSDSFAIKAL